MTTINRVITAHSLGRDANGFPGPRREELNRVVANAYGDMVQYWHANFRTKHFDVGAYNAYGYLPRSRKYNKRKGHRKPLVKTGESLRDSNVYRIEKSRNGAKCIMPLLRKLNFKPKRSLINMAMELRVTNASEIRQFGVVARASLKESLKGKNVKIKVTI